MKNLNFLRFASRLTLLLAVVVSLSLSANAQVTVPDGFQYQAIARDASDVPMAQALISVRFTVDADNAAPVSELFENVTTNDFGLFNLVVGAGVDFDGLVNPTVKIEIDLGDGFVDMGTVPFQSVPYADVAGNVAYIEAGVLHVGDDVFNVGNFFTGTPGIVEPLEAVVVDANKSITGFGDIETGGTLIVGSNIEAQDYVRILSTANNTYGNWQSGALQVKGGAGIANDVWIGGGIVISGSVTALSLAVTNGITAGGDITGGGDLHITDIYAAGNAYITGALEAATIAAVTITASSVTADDFYGNFHGGTLDVGGDANFEAPVTMTSTLDVDGEVNLNDDLTVDGTSTFAGNAEFNANANIANTFTLGNEQGDINELMIGQGQGYTPTWTTVGELMADLTDGAGIEDFTYDGTAAMVVTASIDDATIIFTGTNSDITVDQGYAFDWTAEHRFQEKINAEGTIYSNNGNLTLDDAVDVTGAATLASTLDVDGLATFNNDIDLTSILSVYDGDEKLRVQINADPSINPLDGEANFASFDENGSPLVVLNYRNGKGAIAVTGGADAALNIGATTAYDANYGGYFHGVGNWTTKEGTRISYDPNAKGDDVRIGVSIANGVDVFTVDSDGDVMANDLTINDMTANDITAVNVYADMVDATTVDADYVIVNENVQIDNETITGIINSTEEMVPGDDANLPTAGAVESRFDILFFQELYDNAVNSTDLDNLHIDADSGPLQIYTTHEDGGLDVFATGSQIAIDAALDGSSIEPRTTIQAILDGAYMAQLAATDGQTTAGVLGRINNNNVYGALGATVNIAGVDKHYAGYFNGNVYVKSEFVVGESGYIYLNNTIGSGDANSGAMVVKGGVGIGENLNVAADINGGKNLSIAGNTVLGDDIHNDMFTVNAVSTLNGATTINNTLDVTDAVWFGSTLDVDGATTLNSTLNVSDVATFESDVHANADLYVAGNTEMTGTLTVASDATFNGGTTTVGDAATDQFVVNATSTFNEDVTVNANTDLNGTLDVEDAAHFQDAVTMSSTLDVDGAVNFNDALTVDGLSTFVGPANFTDKFQLDNAEGDVKDLMIGQGAGNTPAWTTVALLMEDLTDGAGIEDFTYDGSATAVVKVELAGNTLEFGTNSGVQVNEGHEFTWTNEHNFMYPINAQGGIYNETSAPLSLDDDVFVAGTLTVSDATMLKSTLEVDGEATFNDEVRIAGPNDNRLTIENVNEHIIVEIGDGKDHEGYIQTWADGNTNPLVTIGMNDNLGAVSATDASGVGYYAGYNTSAWVTGVGNKTTNAGAWLTYSGSKAGNDRIFVSNGTSTVFSVDEEGDVMANDLTINDMQAVDITASSVTTNFVDATVVDVDNLDINFDIDFDGVNITEIDTDAEMNVGDMLADGDDSSLPTSGAVYQHVENRFDVLYFQELYDNAVASTDMDKLHINAAYGPLQIYAPTANGGLDVYATDVAEDAIDARLNTTATEAATVQAILDGTIYGYLGVKTATETAAVYGTDGSNWGAIAYTDGSKGAYAGFFDGNVYMDDDLTVKNNVTIGTGSGGVLSVKNTIAATNTQTAALVVAGGVGIGNNLKVATTIDAGQGLYISGGDYLSVNSTGTTIGTGTHELLTVNSTALFNENTTVDADFHVTGLSNLDGAVAMGSTLDVAGAATMSSTLQVEGATTLNNTLTVASDATFNGDATFNKDLDITNTFSLDGVEGGIDELMIGTGSDNTPKWTTVADLMEDLTDGAGIKDFTYDGSAPAVVTASIDNATIIFTGTDSDITVNEGHEFTWTNEHNFLAPIDAHNGIYNASDVLLLDDDIKVTGTSEFNDDIILTGGDNLLKIDNVNGKRIVEVGDGNANEGFLQTWADDGTELVTIGMNNALGSVSAFKSSGDGVWMANDLTYGWTVGAGNTTTDGIMMSYATPGVSDEVRIEVKTSSTNVFTVDSDGDVVAENVDVNATLNVDGTSTFNDDMTLIGDKRFMVENASGNTIIEFGDGSSNEGYFETYDATGVNQLVLIGAATTTGGSVVVKEANVNRVVMSNDGTKWYSGVTNDPTSFAGATSSDVSDAHLLIVENGITVFDADQTGNVVAAGTITSGNSITIDGTETSGSYGVISESNNDLRFSGAALSDISLLKATTASATHLIVGTDITFDGVTALGIVTAVDGITEPGSDEQLVTEAAVVDYVTSYTLQDAYDATASDVATDGIDVVDGQQIYITNDNAATWVNPSAGATNYIHAMNFEANAGAGNRASGILSIGTATQASADGMPAALGVSGFAYGEFSDAGEQVVGIGGTAQMKSGFGQAIGVAGQSLSTNSGGQNAGVVGLATNATQNIGVLGAFAQPTSFATSSDVAIYGIGTAGHYAGYFDGDVNVTGDLIINALTLDNVTITEVVTLAEGGIATDGSASDAKIATEAAIADWLPAARGVAQARKALVLNSSDAIVPGSSGGFDMNLGTGNLTAQTIKGTTVEVLGTLTATSATSNFRDVNVGTDLTVTGKANLNGQTTIRELKYFIAGAYSGPQTLAATDHMVVFTPTGAELNATLQGTGVEPGQIVTILNAGTASDVNVMFGSTEIDDIAPESATRYVYYGSSWYKVN